MARVRRTDTAPELAVRSVLRSLGVGYRLHAPDLPGRPDIVMRGRRVAIFVNGCFWHGHEACGRGAATKSNTEFWRDRIARNKARDALALKELEAAGWRTLTIWQCETLRPETLASSLSEFLAVRRPGRGRRAPP